MVLRRAHKLNFHCFVALSVLIGCSAVTTGVALEYVAALIVIHKVPHILLIVSFQSKALVRQLILIVASDIPALVASHSNIVLGEQTLNADLTIV